MCLARCLLPSHNLHLVNIQPASHPNLRPAVLARSLIELLPPIEVAAASWCNADPDQPEDWEVHVVLV